MNIWRLILFLFVLEILMGCLSIKDHKGKKIDFSEATKVTYKFNDASVPPSYHRSFVIELTNEKINFRVDSYGDTLVDTSFKISNKRFNELTLKFNKVELSIDPTKNTNSEPVCTGGTSEDLTIYYNSSIIAGSLDHCGGEIFGNIEGELSKITDTLKTEIKDFDFYLK